MIALPRPLALFTAPRVDYSLHRLRHYSGTSPEHFQNFVLFTNYQFYIDEFIALGQLELQNSGSPYSAFVQPGNVITRRAGSDARWGAPDPGSGPIRLANSPARPYRARFHPRGRPIGIAESHVHSDKETKMPKMKTKAAAKKRFSMTASGKVKAGPAGKRHGMIKRSTKFIRDVTGTMILSDADAKIVKKYMPYNR